MSSSFPAMHNDVVTGLMARGGTRAGPPTSTKDLGMVLQEFAAAPCRIRSCGKPCQWGIVGAVATIATAGVRQCTHP